MYNKIEEELKNDLNNEVLRPIYLIFKDSIEVYKELIKEQNKIFSGDYFKGFRGRLLGYIVQKAFDPKLLPSNFPFKIEVAGMRFNQKRPELRRGNTLLTISKVLESNTLPAASGYKKKYSEGNSLFSKQLQFDIRSQFEVKEMPCYGIIAYEFKNEELESLNIVIPDSNFKEIVASIPIPLISAINLQDESITEESILNKENLKSEVRGGLKLKSVK